jgi:MFS family permease
VQRRPAFVLIGVLLGAVTFAASAPSPLYAVYQQRYGFSATTLTAVFAVYALALILALLLTGSLSDRVGRRPVLLASLVLLVLAMLTFAAGDGVGWLVLARVLQGTGTGVATGTLSAMLLDLQHRPGAGPTVSSVAPSFGLGAGVVGAGALVQYGPAPRTLVFWLLLAVFVLAAVSLLAIPETVPYTPGWLRDLRPRVGVPVAARATFVVMAPIVVACWALAGFYLSLGPSLAISLSGSTDRLVTGLPLVALFAAGGVTSVLTPHWPADRSVLLGAAAFAVGVGVTVAAIGAGALWLLVLGSAVAGAGFGPAFAGALRSLAPLVGPTERAGLLTAVYVTAYLAFSAPALVAGLAATHVGLRDTADGYAVVVIVLALAAAAAYALAGRRAALVGGTS